MRSVNRSIHLALLSLLITACNGSIQDNSLVLQNSDEMERPIDTSTSDDHFEQNKLTGKFVFTEKLAEYGPLTTIKVLSNGAEYLVDEVAGSANIIDQFEYEAMGIPGDALSACGAWWAGGGDYFYLRVSTDQLIVYGGWIEEMAPEDEGYHWEERMRIP